jgi:hypothetical protein
MTSELIACVWAKKKTITLATRHIAKADRGIVSHGTKGRVTPVWITIAAPKPAAAEKPSV